MNNKQKILLDYLLLLIYIISLNPNEPFLLFQTLNSKLVKRIFFLLIYLY